jgi:SAM-dependent methyltransferase
MSALGAITGCVLGRSRRSDHSAPVPDAGGYGYFDEDYFERGHLRGTAYCNYRRSAQKSQTYREVAERIAYVFRPDRVLEVGCATGIVVKHLNELGCAAHGVDVSEWAIKHREHENVVLAGAENLPYEDESFDLIYSIHALEHIPAEFESRALSEMTRVARAGALQFHLMPIVGRGPYGDPASVEGLRKDPTHNIIRTFPEWTGAWATAGWHDTGLVILVRHDTESFELTSCQYVLAREPLSHEVLDRARDSNIDVARSLFVDARRTVPRYSEIPLDVLTTEAGLDDPAVLRFDVEAWRDAAHEFETPVSLRDAKFHITTMLLGTGPQRLRMAITNPERESLFGDFRHVCEQWFEIPEGLAQVTADVQTLLPLRGSPDVDAISAIFFGGTAKDCIVQVRIDIERSGTRTRLL